MRIEIKGDESFVRAAYRLRVTAERKRKAAYRRGMARAAKPLGEIVRKDVPEYLPNKGGYAAIVAAALRFKTSSNDDGITIKAQAQGKKEPRQIDKLEGGSLRAPTWPRGPRRIWKSWHTQRVRAHFFTDPIKRHENDIRKEIAREMQEIANEIAGG